MALALRCRGRLGLGRLVNSGFEHVTGTSGSKTAVERNANSAVPSAALLGTEPSTSARTQVPFACRGFASSTPAAAEAGRPGPSRPQAAPSGAPSRAAAQGRPTRPMPQARGPQAAAQGRAPPSRQGDQQQRGPRIGGRGAQDGGSQLLRDDLLKANWVISGPDPENPEKTVQHDALSVLDPSHFTQALNLDALPLLKHLVPERDWRRFASGDLSPEEQENLVDRLSLVLFRSSQGEARQLSRRADMTSNPDFCIGESLGTMPSTDPTQPLPSALDVLTEQRDYFLQELGVSEEEYESIKADVAADFEATVRPLLDARSDSGEAQAQALESVAQASVPEDHVHAAAIKDKLGVLERNAFWPQASKLTFAQRLVKALS
ncbi:hypothetical protein ACKKBG_A05415 [Auxenochlorella protothecoides x Auxenochlorella symbiontica]